MIKAKIFLVFYVESRKQKGERKVLDEGQGDVSKDAQEVRGISTTGTPRGTRRALPGPGLSGRQESRGLRTRGHERPFT